MNLLATFNTVEKQYVIFVRDGKICYGYYVGDDIKENLTDEELVLCNKVKERIIISSDRRNLIGCGKIKYNSKTFQIIFDKVSNRKIFIEFDGKKYIAPTVSEYLYLDDFLNPVIYNSSSPLKKVIVKIGGVILGVVLVLSSYLLYIEGVFNGLGSNFNFTDGVVSFDDHAEESVFEVDELVKLVYENSNLTDDEKKFLSDEIKKLADVSCQINDEYMRERLGDVDFQYIDPSDTEKITTSVGILYKGGGYDPDENVITLVGTNINDSYSRSHEAKHCFHSPEIRSLGYHIQEAVVTIFDLEGNKRDLSLNGGPYKYERNMVYSLIELLGVEVFEEYYYGGGDINVLIKSLLQIINDKNKAGAIIGEIDNIMAKIDILVKENGGWYYDEIVGEAMADFNSLYREYWIAKFGEELNPYDAASIYMNFYNPYGCAGPLNDILEKAWVNVREAGSNAMYDSRVNVIPKMYFMREPNSKECSTIFISVEYRMARDGELCTLVDAYDFSSAGLSLG